LELKDILGEPPKIALEQDATAMDAISAMVENTISSVLVNRLDTEDAFGMVSSSDIITDVIAKGLDPNDVKITEICSKPLVALNNIDLDMRWVAKKMVNAGISRIAVFEGENLRCFVSDVDILKAIAKELKEGQSSHSGKDMQRGKKR